MKILVSTAFPIVEAFPHKSMQFCHSKAVLQKVICSKRSRNRTAANANCVKRSLFKANEWGTSSPSPCKGPAYELKKSQDHFKPYFLTWHKWKN